jgi:photosystem II stability/assembly factor-like uncharacterized protein
MAALAALLSVLLLAQAAGLTSSAGTPDIVLYEEDFEDGRAQDWNLPEGWELTQDSDGSIALHGRDHAFAQYQKDAWSDYSFSLRLKLVSGGIHVSYRLSGCVRYFVGVGEQGLILNKTSPCDAFKVLTSVKQPWIRGRWYEMRISGSGGRIDIYVDGALTLSVNDPDPLLYGTIGVETLDGSEFYVDNVRVTGQPAPTAGLQWVKTGGPIGGLGYDVRMRPDDPDVMFATDAWSGVSMSTDGGVSWAASNEGIVTRAGPSGDAIPVLCLSIDPRDPETVWCGTQNSRGIYKSLDGGRTWTEKDAGVAEKGGISFRGFTVDPRNSDIVYAAAEISSFAWTPDGTTRTGREFDLTRGVVYKTTDGGERWNAIWRGDNLARYIWISPVDSDTLYVSTGIFDREAANTAGLGILKSTDGGETWRVLGARNGLKNLFVGSLFMHPQDPTMLIAATGNVAYRDGSGIYLTTDGGETWRQVLDTRDPATCVEFAVGNPQVAYAGTALAIYRSEDGGIHWTRMTEGNLYGPPGIRAGFPIDFQVDPRNADRIFVNNYGGGNLVSEDGGATWAMASQGYTGAQLRDIAITPDDSRAVYVIGRTGPFRSAAGGADWEGLNFEPATFAEWYALEIDPSDAERVLISDEHQGVLLLSLDGGDTWRIAFRHPSVNAGDFRQRHGFKAIAFAPSAPAIVYAGACREGRNIDDGFADPSFGVYKSTDGGVTWRAASDALIGDQNINVLAVDPGNAEVVYAGTVRKGLLKSVDGGASWQAMNRGLRILDVRAAAIDPCAPDVSYVGVEDGGVYKSVDGGASWMAASTGMDPQAAIRAMVIDPTDSLILYAADLRTGVYRSTDGAKTWVKMNDGLRTRAVKALAISSDGKVLYAATEGEGVFRLDLSPGGG